jgi:outer membrane protein
MQPQRPASLFKRLPLVALLSLAFAGASQAQSLIDMYEMAKGYDAGYQSAKAQYLASQAKADQGKSALLPTLGLSGGATRSDRSQDPRTYFDPSRKPQIQITTTPHKPLV